METMSVLQAGGSLVHGGELKYVETIFSLLDYLTQKIVSLSEVQHLLETLLLTLPVHSQTTLITVVVETSGRVHGIKPGVKYFNSISLVFMASQSEGVRD